MKTLIGVPILSQENFQDPQENHQIKYTYDMVENMSKFQ